MARFTDGQGRVHDLDSLEQGSTGTSTKDIARIALDLASHTKALLGTVSDQALVSDRDKALDELRDAITAIKSIAGKA
jgi:hypothetical protein